MKSKKQSIGVKADVRAFSVPSFYADTAAMGINTNAGIVRLTFLEHRYSALGENQLERSERVDLVLPIALARDFTERLLKMIEGETK